jgi:hypothetical protein
LNDTIAACPMLRRVARAEHRAEERRGASHSEPVERAEPKGR